MRDVSASVIRFAFDMQNELDENEHKNGWADCSYKWLLNRLRQETAELERAIEQRSPSVPSEAADVANFAMMISDNWKADEFRISYRSDPTARKGNHGANEA